jgi:hypothetical protein
MYSIGGRINILLTFICIRGGDIMKCNSCEMLAINGIATHEIGCPDSWKDYKKECKWCGIEFLPENEYQDCCSLDCSEAYN